MPEVSRGKGEQCVEPVPDIRRNHMRYLMHQRDETMHQGIRTKRHSLKECIACHVRTDNQGKAMPVNAPGQFCESCHRYAAVSMDCFQCHATTPGQSETFPEAGSTSVGLTTHTVTISGQAGGQGAVGDPPSGPSGLAKGTE